MYTDKNKHESDNLVKLCVIHSLGVSSHIYFDFCIIGFLNTPNYFVFALLGHLLLT